MVAHHKDFGVGFADRSIVETERTTIEPFRPRFHVVPEWQPQALELADFFGVLAVPKINYVCDAQRLEFPYVAPGGYCTAECQPLAYPKHLHAAAPLCVPNPFVKHVFSKRRVRPHWACQTSHLPHPSHWGFTNALCWQRRPWQR